MRLVVPLLLLAACGPRPTTSDAVPADAALVYEWNTGSLPPAYHRTETIRVAPDGAASLEVQRSYGGGLSQTWPFRLDDAARQRLYAALQEAGLGTRWREESDPPIGGASWTASVTADGQTTRVPSFVVPRQQGAKERVGEAVRAVVPDSVAAARDAWLEATEGEEP